MAGALGLVLLTEGEGSWARWSDRQVTGTGSVTGGSVALTQSGSPVLHLLSRQPAGTRTYASTLTCAAPSGFAECRVVSSTLTLERLVPGDTVRARQAAVLSARASTLRGDLTVDARQVVVPGTSAVSGVAQVSSSLTTPAGVTSPLTANVGSWPVDVRAGIGTGTYTVVTDVALPVTSSGSRWGTDLRGQTLDLHGVTFAFIQSPP